MVGLITASNLMATTFASPPPSISRETRASRPLSPPAARYTIDGSDALEDHLEHSCQLVKQTLLTTLPPNSIEGLLLGGGYGRGEGGVPGPEADRPYNDLEFYLFVHGNRHLFDHRHGATLHRLGHDLAPAIGVEVEFKVLTFEALRRAPISMFFYDMLAGHKWLLGTDDLFDRCKHHRAAHLLPLSEATRLLMNRCSGLLLAREQLAPFGTESADFIRRNIAKAQLAFGDAILAAFGRYHWSCRERHARLQNFSVPLPWRAELIEHHRRGVEFKLHPFRSEEPQEQLAPHLTAAIAFGRDVWLWLESKRLRHSFISARHYATSRVPKWPASGSLRNALLNLKLFRRPMLHRLWRHPRERVLETLALLLWEPLALGDSTLRNLLRANLHLPVTDRAGAVRRYRELWPGVS
jgi:hypothetical protein